MIREIPLENIEVDTSSATRGEIRKKAEEIKFGNPPITVEYIGNDRFRVTNREDNAVVLAAKRRQWLTVKVNVANDNGMNGTNINNAA